jgi:hypothetical protein
LNDTVGSQTGILGMLFDRSIFVEGISYIKTDYRWLGCSLPYHTYGLTDSMLWPETVRPESCQPFV